jgi:hypothetical protein
MTISRILSGLIITAASLALARKLIFVSIDMYFMFDRKLLSKLSQCVWKVLSVYLRHAVSDEDADPGAVIAIQSFGDFLGFHPHAHVLITDGCFYGEGAFRVNPEPNPKDSEDLFRYEVFKMLEAKSRMSSSKI